eukprot:6150040-Amphidinium_carterae.1
MASKWNAVNAFRNFVNRGSKDPTRQGQLQQLQSAFNEKKGEARSQFCTEFYQNCGPKGDLNAYLEAKIVHKVAVA